MTPAARLSLEELLVEEASDVAAAGGAIGPMGCSSLIYWSSDMPGAGAIGSAAVDSTVRSSRPSSRRRRRGDGGRSWRLPSKVETVSSHQCSLLSRSIGGDLSKEGVKKQGD